MIFRIYLRSKTEIGYEKLIRINEMRARSKSVESYDLLDNIFANREVILLGENIALRQFADFHVVGIIGNSTITELPVYDNHYLLDLPNDTVVIIVDDHWEEKIRYEFNTMMSRLGNGKFVLGENYMYSSMLYGKIDTNRLYLLADKNRFFFQSILKKIVGERQLVILYGNCQTHAMTNLLSNNQEFRQKYVVCEMPKLWLEEDKEKFTLLAESGLLSHVDYFFTQQVRSENRFGYMASTEYMISLLSDRCKVITITNLCFMGYFPQYLPMFHSDTEMMRVDFLEGKVLNTGRFIDHEILKLIVQGYSDEEIINRISLPDYFKAEEVKAEIEKEWEQFALREEKENVDIKMSEWLQAHYYKKLLFVTQNHPTKEALLEFARRILSVLEIKDLQINCDEGEILSPMPKDLRLIVYPSVTKALGLPERDVTLHVKLKGCELSVLRDIDEDLDQFIEKNMQDLQRMFEINMQLNFTKYMRVYLRIVQSLLHI